MANLDRANLIVFKTDELAHAAATHLYQKINEVIDKKGICRIALSGGSTPVVAFGLLAKTDLPWDKLQIFLADERCLPPDHKDSNYYMLTQTLLTQPALPKTHIFRWETELSPVEAAKAYSVTIEKVFGTSEPAFDIIQLGMGDDGHTASLFPGTPVLEATGIAASNYAPTAAATPDRLTLTQITINNADHVVFLIGGASKAQILKEILHGDYQPEKLPTQLINPPHPAVFLLDEAAAALVL